MRSRAQDRTGMASDLARRVVGRSAAFYAAHLTAALLPLASVPYLTRTLGSAAWGELALAQAIAATLSVLVDYGHAQSGTRALLRAERPGQVRRIAATILASKFVLVALGAVVTAGSAALGIVPVRSDLLSAAIVAGSVLGLAPLWLVQAGDRVGPFLALDVVGKALSVVALLVLVRGPGDAPRVLWLQASAGLLSLAGGLLLASVRPAARVPRPAEILRVLREQRHGFLFRATILGYTTANVVVLGWVAPAEEVGIFAAADRTVRLVACFAGPLGQALYPLLARTWQEDPAVAARLAARTALGVTGVGLLLGLALYAAADPIARLLFGPAFAPAASVFRILAPLPALICVSNILGMQWMFSIGAEAAFVRVLTLAGLVCLPTGATLGAAFGARGMAVAATLAELVVTGGIVVHLLRNKQLPVPGRLGSRAHAH